MIHVQNWVWPLRVTLAIQIHHKNVTSKFWFGRRDHWHLACESTRWAMRLCFRNIWYIPLKHILWICTSLKTNPTFFPQNLNFWMDASTRRDCRFEIVPSFLMQFFNPLHFWCLYKYHFHLKKIAAEIFRWIWASFAGFSPSSLAGWLPQTQRWRLQGWRRAKAAEESYPWIHDIRQFTIQFALDGFLNK